MLITLGVFVMGIEVLNLAMWNMLEQPPLIVQEVVLPTNSLVAQPPLPNLQLQPQLPLAKTVVVGVLLKLVMLIFRGVFVMGTDHHSQATRRKLEPPPMIAAVLAWLINQNLVLLQPPLAKTVVVGVLLKLVMLIFRGVFVMGTDHHSQATQNLLEQLLLIAQKAV
jgi:hypothetical protein